MEREPIVRADGVAPSRPGSAVLCLVLLLGLIAWQGWMTLGLFGGEMGWQHLQDEEPLVAGRHALHLYHGYLGAQSLFHRGTLCSFDPNFHAGYPKTPIFDSGSRPAEFFLSFTQGEYQPAAYKIGLASCCVLVPLLLILAGWGAGLDRWGIVLATLLGLLVWWSTPYYEALVAGQLDLLLGSVAALLQACLLLGYHREPGFFNWLALLISGCLGWFAHPLLFLLCVPLLLIYYLTVGPRHPFIWHFALLLALGGGVLCNLFWLDDWIAYWWIQTPLEIGVPLLAHRTFHTVWDASLWGDPTDRALAVFILAAALAGAIRCNVCRERPSARILGIGTLGFVASAIAGITWEPMGRVGMSHLLLPGLLFALPLAVVFLRQVGHLLSRSPTAMVVGLVMAAGVLYVGREQVEMLLPRIQPPLALQSGLAPERQQLVALLREQTTPEGRILWEDRSGPEHGWSALLPLLTQRSYLGGLDAEAMIEHAYPTLKDESLAGRPIASWTDAELNDFCRRYNVAWIVCWSPKAVQRFQNWPGIASAAPIHEQGSGYLFKLKRQPSFVLAGKAKWLNADHRRIDLEDVQPDEQGLVILSLHYQSGLRVSPGRVLLEREVDPFDPIPLVRLRLTGPVARVTLTWDPRGGP